MKKVLVVNVAGSYAMKFVAGHFCGSKSGFGVYIATNLYTKRDFRCGGVMSFQDIKKLYRIALREEKQPSECSDTWCRCHVDRPRKATKGKGK